MNNIWLTSDLHYGHKNIIRGCSEWTNKSRCRNFDTVEEHDTALVTNINNVVKEDDVLYCLGDWSFGHFDNIRKFREQLNCRNIKLILGNHDHHIERNKDNIRDLFSSVHNYYEKTINDQRIIFCHYAMRVWNLSQRGSWMLYGHSHGTLDDLQPQFPQPTWIGDDYYIKNSKSMDTGIDCHPEFRPFHFDEIKEIMDSREILLNVDHHTE